MDETSIDLSSGPVNIDFNSTTKRVAVQVLQFKNPAAEYFCDDVDGDPEPIEKWTGLTGKVTIERSTATPPKKYANATHSVSHKLTAFQIKNKKTGAIATLDDVLMDGVLVGWLAG